MKKQFLLALAFSFSLNGFAQTAPKWQEKMQELAAVLANLLPELASEKSDPKILEKNAKKLSELSHGIEMGRKKGNLIPPGDLDPSVMILSRKFAETSKQAYLAIHQEQLEYGKSLLKTVTTYCVGCHTRHENGPDFPFFPLDVRTEKLTPTERANLYVSTRQFDKGLIEFQKLISDENLAKTQPFAWGRNLRQALAIIVRVKQDSLLAETTIEKALKLSGVPDFEKEAILHWKKAIEKWKKEPASASTNDKTQSQLVKEMNRLNLEAQQAQSGPLDHVAEIQYLRTSAAAHDVLRVSKNPKVKAEALFVAGTSYESLATPNFWPLHELWYEACIRELPHTSLAVRCYNRLEESVYFGFTGSAGTHIPGDVEENLKKMKALAVAPSKPR